MDTASNLIDQATALLERLTIPELEQRLYALRAEERTICTLLRTVRAREAVARRRIHRNSAEVRRA